MATPTSNNRNLLLALLVLLLLAGGAAVGILLGSGGPAASVAANTTDPVAAPQPGPQPAPANESETEPETKPTPEPPPPPLEPAPAFMDSDPRVITLRLVDADTEQPIAHATCGMSGAYTNFDAAGSPTTTTIAGLYLPTSTPPPPEMSSMFTQTDGQGLVLLRINIDKVDTGSQFTRALYRQHSVHWRLPTPGGWEPVFDIHDVGVRIAALRGRPQQFAIDLRWRRGASVTVTVRSPDGTSLPGAVVQAFATSAPDVVATWASRVSPTYGELRQSPDPAQALEAKLASIRQKMAHRNERGLIPTFRYDQWSGHQLTDGHGQHTLENLFRGTWTICAWHPVHEPQFVSVEVKPGSQQVNLTLQPNGLAALRVVAEAMDGDTPVQSVLIYVHRSGPHGPLWYAHFEATRLEQAPLSHEFAGLFPATYFVTAQAYCAGGDPCGVTSARLVTLAPNESQEVRLPVGQGATANWEPIVLLGGERLQDIAFSLEGDPYPSPRPILIRGKAQTFVPLPPGHYTAELPGQPPHRFSLAPGEHRKDEFRVPLRPVTCTLATDVVEDSHGAIFFVHPKDAVFDKNIVARANGVEDLEWTLTPGKSAHFLLPPGQYSWTLFRLGDGDDDGLSFQGLLSVSLSGANTFTFSLDSMPGMARLDIDMTAWHRGQEWPFVQLRGNPARAFGSSHDWHDDGLDTMGRINRAARLMFFAPPGRYLLSVGDRVRVVDVPGNLTLRPGDDVLPATVRWTSETISSHESIEVVDSQGIARFVYKDRDVPVMSGRVRVHASWYLPTSRGVSAQKELTLAEGANVIDLDTLDWSPLGSFTVTCEGRGSPEALHDAWWRTTHEDSDTTVRVLALDHADALGPAVIKLGLDHKWSPGSRLAFRCATELVPAGRYKAIPWPGAPEHYCVTFTVKAGEETQVLLKGG